MERLKNLLFSSYKRTAAVLFVATLVLAIPFTISLLGRQQDIRQRASGLDVNSSNCQAINDELNSLRTDNLCGDANIVCDTIASRMQTIGCTVNQSSITSTDSGNNNNAVATATPTLTQQNRPCLPADKTSYDLNNDGIINHADLKMISDHFLEKTEGSATLERLDIDHDGRITIIDIAMVAAFHGRRVCDNGTPTPTATASATSMPSPTPTNVPLSAKQKLYDFNDDGVINEPDYNILYSGFAKRQGD